MSPKRRPRPRDSCEPGILPAPDAPSPRRLQSIERAATPAGARPRSSRHRRGGPIPRFLDGKPSSRSPWRDADPRPPPRSCRRARSPAPRRVPRARHPRRTERPNRARPRRRHWPAPRASASAVCAKDRSGPARSARSQTSTQGCGPRRLPITLRS